MTPEALEEYVQRTGIRHWEDPAIYADLGVGIASPHRSRVQQAAPQVGRGDLREEVRLLTARVTALEAASTSAKPQPSQPAKAQQIHLFEKP